MLLDTFTQEPLKFKGASEHLVDFMDWCKEDMQLCGVSSTVSLFYEYCPSNLEMYTPITM
jgi:hypothetical protein